MNHGNLARVVPPPAPRLPTPARLTGMPGKKTRAAPRTAPRTSAGLNWGTLVIVVTLLLINLAGAPYYLRSLGERVRHPLHPLLRPSGLVGQSAGIVAFLVFVFLWLYPLRKKWKVLAFTGPVGKWLDVHVTTAIGLPLLLTIHAAWRSDGVIGLGFGAMLVVCASGVVGRYLYTRIPRAKSGVELTREEVVAERNRLIDEIADATGIDPRTVEATLDVASPSDEKAGVVQVLRDLMTNDLRRWRMTRELRRRFQELEGGRAIPSAALATSVKLAGREIALSQQVRMLEATHRVFRYWHIAHKPFAMTALLAVVIHVVVVVAVGATWFH